jgi:hypothetical protein
VSARRTSAPTTAGETLNLIRQTRYEFKMSESKKANYMNKELVVAYADTLHG